MIKNIFKRKKPLPEGGEEATLPRDLSKEVKRKNKSNAKKKVSHD